MGPEVDREHGRTMGVLHKSFIFIYSLLKLGSNERGFCRLRWLSYTMSHKRGNRCTQESFDRNRGVHGIEERPQLSDLGTIRASTGILD